MSQQGAEQIIPQGKTNVRNTIESMIGEISFSTEIDGDQATNKNRFSATNGKSEAQADRGIEAMREEDCDHEGDEDDDDDEEGDNDDVEGLRVINSTTDGNANATVNGRRKKVRKRRRVRKRNNTSVNDVNEENHHSTSYAIEGVKPTNPTSPGKGSATNISSQHVQPNQKSKKPHDAPMTKSDLYYAIRFGMVQVEVDVIQPPIPQDKQSIQGTKSDVSDGCIITTIVRDVIGRVLLVNWDNITVYDAFVVPELSSTQQGLLQGEFKSFKPPLLTGMENAIVNVALPYTFQVKRIIDYRSEQTGIFAHHYGTGKSSKEPVVSISDLKPILKKFTKGKIVIGYNVQADLQVIDGMAHPKTDLRDVSQFGPYMNTIVTARPMSLHTSQDKQQIVHFEPRPLSRLIDMYYTGIDSSSGTHPKNMYGLLFKEAVGCLHLYKRVRSEWEDQLCRLSRHRYKFPPLSTKPTESKSPLPPPLSQKEMKMPAQLAPMKQYYQDLSPSMMKSVPVDLPNHKHQSLPHSSYQHPQSYIDSSIRAKQYEDLRYHQSNPTFSEQQRWNSHHVPTGTMDPPYTRPASRYHRQIQSILPACSPSSEPSQGAFFGQTEYGTSPRRWEMQRHSDANLQATERLSTHEERSWGHSQGNESPFQKTVLQEDPWSLTSASQLLKNAECIADNLGSMVQAGDTVLLADKNPYSNVGVLDYHGTSSFENVTDRNARLLPTIIPSNTWSPLLTDSLSLLSIFNANAATSTNDHTVLRVTQPTPALPLPQPGTTTVSDSVVSGTGDVKNNSSVNTMFQWDELLSSINE